MAGRAHRDLELDTGADLFEAENSVPDVVEEEEEKSALKNQPLDADNDLLNAIPPAQWESTISILDFLTKDSDDAVIIKDSKITHMYRESTIIEADLTSIFKDDQKLNLHISSPKKWCKLFKIFKNKVIYILDDDQNSRFIVTDNQTKLFLPKQQVAVMSECMWPDLEGTKTIQKMVITRDTRDRILELGRGMQYIEYLVSGDKIKAINIPDTAVFILPEFLHDKDARKLNTGNASIVLRTRSFLPYPADTYNLILGINDQNTYFTTTSCIANAIHVKLYENLDDATDVDTFI